MLLNTITSYANVCKRWTGKLRTKYETKQLSFQQCSSVILHRRVYPPVSILNSVINNISPNLTINLPTYFFIISLLGETSLVAILADITTARPAASLPHPSPELINHCFVYFYELMIYQWVNEDVWVKFWKFNRRWNFRVSHDCSIGTTSKDLYLMWNFC